MERCRKGKEDMKLCLGNISVNTDFVSICDVMANPGEVSTRPWRVPAKAALTLQRDLCVKVKGYILMPSLVHLIAPFEMSVLTGNIKK